jgi:hypothetical protein
MIRFLKLSAVTAMSTAAIALVGIPLVSAAGMGTIEGGDIYRAKNLTKNNPSFVDPINADACDSIEYRVRIHNPSVDNAALTNVRVSAAFPTAASTVNTSIATVRADNAFPNSTSDTATVSLSTAQTLSYVSGSTRLMNAQGSEIKSLPDGVTGSGVNIGTVGVSIGEIRFVQFKMKVSCPQPPAPKVKFACVALDVTKVDRTRFDFTARASVENATVQSYVFTTKNSGNSTVDTTTVTTNALSAVYHFNQSTAGTYTVNAVVNTDKGSTGVTNVCTKKVTVEAAPVVQGEVKKEELPKTGAAGLAGLFAGASALGTAGHYMFRRFRN